MAKATKNGDIRILVHQRGWVFVGSYRETDSGHIILEPFAVVRRWGTSKGLPELAENGPLGSTILDKGVGVFKCAKMTELFTLSCNPEKWAGKL